MRTALPPLLLTLTVVTGLVDATSYLKLGHVFVAVADLTTTVLTMTLTGVAADAALAGGPGSKLGRRALSVGAMLLGALIGGLLVLKVDNAAPLALASGLLAIVARFAYRASRSTPKWASV